MTFVESSVNNVGVAASNLADDDDDVHRRATETFKSDKIFAPNLDVSLSGGRRTETSLLVDCSVVGFPGTYSRDRNRVRASERASARGRLSLIEPARRD